MQCKNKYDHAKAQGEQESKKKWGFKGTR